jgi:hypothetical protein
LLLGAGMSLIIQQLRSPSVAVATRQAQQRASAGTVRQPSRASSPALADTRLERLIKLIPADVAGIYIPAIGLGSLTTWRWYSLAIAIAGTVLVPVLLYLDTRPGRPPAVQYVVRTFAFVAWAFLVSQPLSPWVVEPVIPALIAMVLPVVGERLLR